jgi:hypothetical protein
MSKADELRALRERRFVQDQRDHQERLKAARAAEAAARLASVKPDVPATKKKWFKRAKVKRPRKAKRGKA